MSKRIYDFEWVHEAYLVVLIKREEREVSDTNWLPMVRDLRSSAVYNMGHLVCDNKF